MDELEEGWVVVVVIMEGSEVCPITEDACPELVDVWLMVVWELDPVVVWVFDPVVFWVVDAVVGTIGTIGILELAVVVPVVVCELIWVWL